MKFDIRSVIEGWKNDLFPAKELKDEIRKTQAERLEICKACTFNSTPGVINSFSTCKDCGCPLKKKTACLSCMCPQEKWLPTLTSEEDTELQKQINYKSHEEEL